jgi:NADH dehydrogenase FAD-containing subunit/uncharacterized membrane protein YphA (DoxX/SURF4 family)
MNSIPQFDTVLPRLVVWGQLSFDRSVWIVRQWVWPKVEVTMRLWLAKIFLMSGILKLGNWQTALELATYEYPVSFLSAVHSAYLGVSVELLGGVLLALGAMTRLSAVALFGLSVVIQVEYRPFDNQLFWMALFAWYAIGGAGPISVDRLLARGLAESAMPSISTMVTAFQWLTVHAKPVYLCLLRIWLAMTLLIGVSRLGLLLLEREPALAMWLPLKTAALLSAPLRLAGGVLLLIGLATRYLGAVIIAALFAGAMMDPRVTEAAYLLMVFSVLFVDGAGIVSGDQLLSLILRRYFAPSRWPDWHAAGAPRVVIVGAGFGGISCAKAFRYRRVAVTLIDRTNYHLFQPLLYQVATAALSPGDIAAPLRPVFRDDRGIRVLLGNVSGIDPAKQVVMLDREAIPYDYLVVATGATHSYFGRDEWAQWAPGLKKVEDALEIRRRILTAFELAERAATAAERAALLTFLIVGGGPTGVELAGAIAELAKHGMDKEFRTFDPASARILLVQSAPRLLPAFPERLALIAQRAIEKLGVEVLLGHRVESIDARGVKVEGMEIAARTVLWAAGVTASPAATWLGVEADAAGRIKVAADLGIPGISNAFAVGDTAASTGWQGKSVPGLAPAAKQGGAYVARVIRARMESRAAPAAFKYRHLGSLATIGRKAAVADFGFARLWGAPAWWLWGLIHLGALVGVRNRVATMVNWLWAYLTFKAGVRLITAQDPSRTLPWL